MEALEFDKHVRCLLQKFEGQSFPSILPRTCEETNNMTSMLREWEPDKNEKLEGQCEFANSLHRKWQQDEYADRQYELIACVRVLDLLGIEVVIRETLRASLRVCSRAPWRRAFLSRRFQKAKEVLLHVATIEALPIDYWCSDAVCNETSLYLLVPQIQNKNMIECFLKIAVCSPSKEQICLIPRLLNVEADSFFKQCMSRALRDGEWCVVDHLIRLPDMDKTTLHEVLVKAMAHREWIVVETCLERGADIATACTETGFDLNARSGKNNRTVIHDAMDKDEDRVKKMMLPLLQAGADLNVPDSYGETAVCSAARKRKWDFALLLLKHCRAAGTFTYPIFCNGEPVVHFACKKGQSDLVQELFATQTDPLATDDKGNTLMMAALDGVDSIDPYDEFPEFSTVREIVTIGEREDVMRVLIQSGVATHQALLSQSQLRSLKQEAKNVTMDSFKSPMWQAVKKRKLRMARMLYAAGACCHEEIHELVNSEFIEHKFEETNQRDTLKFSEDFFSHFRSYDDACACCHTEIHELANSEYVREKVKRARDEREFMAFLNNMFSHVRSQGMQYTVGMCCTDENNDNDREIHFVRQKIEEMKNWCDIIDFLNHISSHPRSLRDICALTISHLIGCGPQRDERAASLGLPDSLRRRVLQDHVISPDFLKDYPPTFEDSQPFRGTVFGGFGSDFSPIPFELFRPRCSCQIEEDE